MAGRQRFGGILTVSGETVYNGFAGWQHKCFIWKGANMERNDGFQNLAGSIAK